MFVIKILMKATNKNLDKFMYLVSVIYTSLDNLKGQMKEKGSIYIYTRGYPR